MSIISKIKSNNFPKSTSPAIVIGLDSLQGLQTARILSSRGISVIGLVEDKYDHARHTNVCDRIIFCKTEGEDLVQTLLDLAKGFNQKAVLVTCQEKNVFTVSKERSRLQDYYFIMLPNHNIVETFLDKAKFYKYAEANNLKVPKTFIINGMGDFQKFETQIFYPCIIKPANRSSAWIKKTSIKAFVVSTKEEIINIIKEYQSFTDSFVISKWIEGPDTNHFTCNSYFNRNSEEIVSFISKKIRQWPLKTGQGCFAEESTNETVRKESIKIFMDAGFVGFTYMDMKKDNLTGDYYIIEPNIGRPTGRSAMAEASGVEFIYSMYCDATGLNLPQNRTQKNNGIKWMHIRRDLMAAISLWKNGELSLSEWLKSIKGKKIFAIFSINDPLPFIFDFIRVSKLIFRKHPIN